MGCSKPPKWLRLKMEKDEALTEKEREWLEHRIYMNKTKEELIDIIINKGEVLND